MLSSPTVVGTAMLARPPTKLDRLVTVPVTKHVFKINFNAMFRTIYDLQAGAMHKEAVKAPRNVLNSNY